MPIDDALLNILCCPETRQDLRPMNEDELRKLNTWIETAQLNFRDGSPIELPVTEALITVDGSRVYVIRDEIPVMLIDKIIDLTDGWKSV